MLFKYAWFMPNTHRGQEIEGETWPPPNSWPLWPVTHDPSVSRDRVIPPAHTRIWRDSPLKMMFKYALLMQNRAGYDEMEGKNWKLETPLACVTRDPLCISRTTHATGTVVYILWKPIKNAIQKAMAHAKQSWVWGGRGLNVTRDPSGCNSRPLHISWSSVPTGIVVYISEKPVKNAVQICIAHANHRSGSRDRGQNIWPWNSRPLWPVTRDPSVSHDLLSPHEQTYIWRDSPLQMLFKKL